MVEKITTVHATCVSVAGKGVLITGPSNSGKSALALQLIANGANLVADDRTVVVVHNGRLQASVPNAIAGLIEARGVGLLSLQYVEAVELALVVEMGSIETARLPQPHTATFLAIELPCLHKVDAPYFPAAIYAYLSAIRIEAL